jgi:hypothetical protein
MAEQGAGNTPPGLTTETVGAASMATDNSASIVTLVQPKRPLTGAERTRAYRERQRAAKALIPAPAPGRAPATVTLLSPSESVTARHVTSQRRFAPILLHIMALMLAAVGVTMNGWFARSLGSSDAAGWMFLAVGVAADGVALVMPAIAAHLWQRRQIATAVAGWLVWVLTFVFAMTASIGFASVNISDVTQTRASRVTPAIVTAQNALGDAMTARDRECKGGVGKFCREREEMVNRQRAVLIAAMADVAATADPQVQAAVNAVTWLSGGKVRPMPEDFMMLRLILLALLPQIGGILVMIGRASTRAA